LELTTALLKTYWVAFTHMNTSIKGT
jgi:hypothetical protein